MLRSPARVSFTFTKNDVWRQQEGEQPRAAELSLGLLAAKIQNKIFA